MIVILNRKKKDNRIGHDIKKYCGRGSPLGNEFSHLNSTQHETTKVANREEACDQMRLQILKYLLDSKNLFPKSQKIKDAFNEIYKAHNNGQTIALECFCKNRDDSYNIDIGERCHTEDIKLILEHVHAGIKSGVDKETLLKQLQTKWSQI